MIQLHTSYTIDQQGNYHYTWKGNWSPNQVNHSSQSNYSYNNYSYNYNNYNNYNNYSNNTQSYSANTQQTGGLGASYSTSDRNIKVTTTTAPSSQSTGVSISRTSSSGSNLYTGQCTYYVFDRVGGKIGSTWGNANNWASAAEVTQ